MRLRLCFKLVTSIILIIVITNGSQLIDIFHMLKMIEINEIV